MSRLENVINDLVENRKSKNRAWIYNENGEISDDVICGDILPFLNELKAYEINISDSFIEDFKKDADNFYTYNYGCNIDKDISVWYKKGVPVLLCTIHLYGDARCGFSDWFAVKMDDYYDNDPMTQFLQFESVYQTVDIDDRYCADINIFQEEYDVYDTTTGNVIGTDYSLEKKYLDIFKEN